MVHIQFVHNYSTPLPRPVAHVLNPTRPARSASILGSFFLGGLLAKEGGTGRIRWRRVRFLSWSLIAPLAPPAPPAPPASLASLSPASPRPNHCSGGALAEGDQTTGVRKLIIVPHIQLDHLPRAHHRALRIDDTRPLVVDEVRAHERAFFIPV